MKTFLHVGCGPVRKDQTTCEFAADHWSELRLDIDPSAEPDVIGTMTDMSALEDSAVDAIFSSHNVEHLYPHEIPLAIKEFLRVLSDDGFAVVTVPDLQSVCALVASGKLLEPAYQSPAGPISPIDILYGFRPALARGNLYMAHRSGFTEKVLSETLLSAGFRTVACRARPSHFDLWALATKKPRSREEMTALVAGHFPS